MNRSATSSDSVSLFLISVLSLFLELLLIRWIGTEINIFAYLQNTVLVVCFLGLGIGCWTCHREVSLRSVLVPLFFLVLLLSVPLTQQFLRNISLLLSALGDLVLWDEAVEQSPGRAVFSVALGLLATIVLMRFIWEMFVPLGRLLGRYLDEHPSPILAYSINVGGSLIGIWLFVLLGAFYLSPFWWFVVVAFLMLYFVKRYPRGWKGNLALLAAILVCSIFAGRSEGAIETLWSPYQKLSLVSAPPNNPAFQNNLLVNNYPFQGIAKHTDEILWKDPRILYDLPMLFYPQAETSLIVGAGTGNDVSGHLRHPVKKITAVEIDPAVLRFGKLHHPSKPYQSSRVEVVNDDARSYFATSTKRFDLITLAMLDSHTMNAMTNSRLDHYVYTKESLERAKKLLTDDGMMVLTFFAKRPFIADRIERVLREVFGKKPIAFRMPIGEVETGGVLFIAGNTALARRNIQTNPELNSLISRWKEQYSLALSDDTPITTDDWPYLYLRSHQIPILYYVLAVMVFLLLVYAKRKLQVSDFLGSWSLKEWHFFFLGAAFLLLEVQNISKSSVVLGNTWEVNAVIISGVMVMILLANIITALFPRLPIALVYVLLICSCVGLFFVDLAGFAFLPYFKKAVIVGLLVSVPMVFSGIVFIRSFAESEHKDKAFGANLLGALVGGLLQSITFVTGIKVLLLVVAGLYIAAMACHLPRRR